ncbi:MAG: HTH-type transcriptional regulator DmlR [Candidatus Celerinatantimonas neptuna]|nr:MAG: HTH-type transcriptional regulator DmlR [Candidatus Celerinatantimonas neptuna]
MDKLNLMNSFVHVAELKSYTAAAAKLNKTKALMSTHVRQLEEVLDIRLISRSTRGFMLTEAGMSYYHQARKIIDEISELEAGLLEGEQQMAGRLRLSVPNTFGERVMMGFMGEFMQRYPKMNIEVMLADQFVDLINQGFDLAIRIGLLQDSTMIAKEIGQSKTVVVASRKLLGDGEFHSPDDLKGMPMIFDTNLRGERQRWTCYNDQQEYVLDLRPAVYINSASASAQLACSGVGFALCPYFAVKEYLEAGQLELVLPEYQFGYAPIHAVYPNRQQLSVRARQFINEFAEYLKQEDE